MTIFESSAGQGTRYIIEIAAVSCGEDLSLIICGGTKYHIGAAAVGCGRLPDGSSSIFGATVSSIAVPEHKDDVVARSIAKKLASELHTTVSVTAGIHIDDAAPDELVILQKNADEAADRLLDKIKAARNDRI